MAAKKAMTKKRITVTITSNTNTDWVICQVISGIIVNKIEARFLDTLTSNRYNIACAEVAQVVEQRTENPRVVSSILTLGTKIRRSGSSSAVERLLAKERVASSNLVFRSKLAPAGVAEW